jgi:hypothetical protein
VARISSAPATTRPEPATPDSGAALFSADYTTARTRFLTAARQPGTAVEVLPVAARGPGDEDLSIDIAWLGARDARRILLHVSGVHGVEAYAGSAAQLALLNTPPAIPPDGALVLVHALNPYGMAWLRRTNEHNVDLNRNFLPDTATWAGAPPLYRRLDRLLNPPSPPTRDGFGLRLAMRGLRHGFHAMRQAIAHGQHRYPRGLFYGGAELQPGPRQFCDWLQRRLTSADSVFAIDMHTGLGPHAGSTLIVEPGINAATTAELEAAVAQALIGSAAIPAAYSVRGSLGAALPRLLPGVDLKFVLQEIGTGSSLHVLQALRDENRWHHYGEAHLDHPAKRQIREALCPASPAWRSAAVAHGSDLVYRAADWLFRKKCT